MNFSRRQFLKSVCRLGSVGLLASYPLVVERMTVLTNEYRIEVPNLPEAFSGFRIVHLSDFHYGRLTPLMFIKGIVERANCLKPDLIACTGDYVNRKSSSDEIDEVWQVLSRLTAPNGVWSVLGNHDHWSETARAEYWLIKNSQDLRHKAVRIESPCWSWNYKRAELLFINLRRQSGRNYAQYCTRPESRDLI